MALGVLSTVGVYTAFAVSVAFMVHVNAQQQENESFFERISGGPKALTTMDFVLLGSLSLLGMEILDFISKNSGKWFQTKMIPVRGKHLDDLSTKDLIFIGLSKAATAPFVYLYFSFAYNEPNVIWDLSKVTIQNTFVSLVSFFVVYDFFYTLLHWALHIKAVYGYIHKHHHHQKAPSRANVDAINVHPVEYFLGEYNHLFTVFLCTRVMPVHVVACFAFLGIGGFLAGINHTRYDIKVSIFGIELFDSKAHDVHHRIPQSNYGQYIMLWDRIFGTYREYNPKDRVNPEAQLDPKTGKSLQYGKAKSQ